MTEESPELRRIRALLTKAERTENEHEAEAYTQAALRLIAVHGVDEEMLAARRPDPGLPGKREISLTGTYTNEQMHLLTDIAAAYPSQSYYVTSGRTVKSVVLFGFEDDLNKIEFLFTLLLVQMTGEAAKVQADRADYPGWYDARDMATMTRRLRRGFMRGYAVRIHQRLVALFADARRDYDREHTGESSDLVVQSKGDKVLALYNADDATNDVKLDRPRNYDGRGLDLGRDAADRADLGGTKLKTAGQRALTA
jgi:hypothetical protein